MATPYKERQYFPRQANVCMAIEAFKALALDHSADADIDPIRLTDVELPRAIAFDSDDESIETIFSVFM